MLSSVCSFRPCFCRATLPFPVMCREASVVACLRASVWAEEQTQSIVVLRWDHKRRRCSLWLSCLSCAMFCCMFLVLFTACLNNWHRVNRASFSPCLWNKIYTCIATSQFFFFFLVKNIKQVNLLSATESWTPTELFSGSRMTHPPQGTVS